MKDIMWFALIFVTVFCLTHSSSAENNLPLILEGGVVIDGTGSSPIHEAGMSPYDIIVSATKNAAEVCGLGSELGTLEPGKIADVLVINGNPLNDLTNLTKVKLVIKSGTIIRE